MKIYNKDKINILLNLLNERYNASHKIRERGLKFTIWILGYAIAFVWILLNDASLTLPQKWVLTVLVIVIGGITFWFLYALEKGFDNNRKVTITLEEILGCYKKGPYLASKTIFPSEYKDLKEKSRFAHFKSIYILLISVFLIIICLIWITPTLSTSEKPGSSISNTKPRIYGTR